MATITDYRNRLSRIETWLYGPADRFGECDECHADHVALWDDIDTEGCGDFASCRECWNHRVATLKDKIRLMKKRLAETPISAQPVMFSGLDCLPGQQDLFPTDGGI